MLTNYGKEDETHLMEMIDKRLENNDMNKDGYLSFEELLKNALDNSNKG